MPNLNLTGVTIKFLHINPTSAGVHTSIHLSANYSKAVCKAMGWSESRDGDKRVALEGDLSAKSFILTPPADLAKHEIQLDISSVSAFVFASIETEEGAPRKSRLDFKVTSGQEGAEAYLGEYLRKTSNAKATLRIAYEKQTDLELKEGGQGELEGMVKDIAEKKRTREEVQ